MGKSAAPDYIAGALIWLVALFCLGNGAFMLSAPMNWYWAIPTVPATGPANMHFIADIGLAYICCGALLVYGAWYPAGRWLALVAGSLWLAAHGLFHIYELAAGMSTVDRFLSDVPGVLGPPLLVFVALTILGVRRRITPAGIPKRVFLSLLEKLEPGESDYMRAIASAPGHALEKFMHLMPAAMHRHAANPDIFHLARIGATLEEDCGPCAMTAAHGALADGLAPDLVNQALSGGESLLGDQQTAYRFGQAIARHSVDAFTLGEELERKFGRAVRLELAMTAAFVRGYPAMKRGLGLNKSCAMTRLAV
jgi:uncharacterized membrane protein (DUF2068 family)